MLFFYFILNCLSSFILIKFLIKSKNVKLYDMPVARSLHNRPKKKIGGLSLFILILLNVIFFFTQKFFLISLFSFCFILIIFLINLYDDLYNISPLKRLLAFLFFYYLIFLVNFENIFSINIIIFTLIFLTISIFTNFNDGADFYIILNYFFLIFALFLFNLFKDNNLETTYLSLIFLSSLFSLSFFNFPPSKIFLGDSGSYLVSIYPMLIFLIYDKNIDIILITFHFLSPILLDGFFTLIYRLYSGKNIFTSHREHFFQKLVLEKGHLFLIKSSAILYMVNFLIYVFFVLLELNFLTLMLFSLINYYLYRKINKKYVFRI